LSRYSTPAEWNSSIHVNGNEAITLDVNFAEDTNSPREGKKGAGEMVFIGRYLGSTHAKDNHSPSKGFVAGLLG